MNLKTRLQKLEQMKATENRTPVIFLGLYEDERKLIGCDWIGGFEPIQEGETEEQFTDRISQKAITERRGLPVITFLRYEDDE